MIDTDKYEGHSEMIDANEIGEIWEYLADTISEDNRGRAEANYNLVADAPLLLAEVKRLREKLESIQNSMAWTVQVWWNENYMGREGWMEQMCEVYADLAKGIEAQYHGEEEE
jgi:hypothetical protein